MDTFDDYMRQLSNDIFYTFAYVADSMREAGDVRGKVDKMVEGMSKLPIKNDKDMEEKKTKKMTKAEAFEWLKGKKVKCYDSLHGLWYEVQKKMLECGCVWAGLGAPPNGCVWALYVKEGVICYLPISNADEYNDIECKEVLYDDILSIEIVEEEETLSVDCALEHAKWIMKYLREECSPHTKMIIEGDHAEFVEGVKSVVWKEDIK